MLSFYPGPSKVYDTVGGYLQDAFTSGLLSINHRSPQAMQLVEKTIFLFRKKMGLPASYALYFLSSATEAWEVIGQSLGRGASVHVYNGAFGEKWAGYMGRLGLETVRRAFGPDQPPPLPTCPPGTGLLCLTHNETSNGTMLPGAFLQEARRQTDALICVDATSSMGGVALDWQQADVWLASVQKCFGLPAGLGLLAASPQAIERAAAISERNHYNSLLSLHENFLKNQTVHTPNVLGIYLLGRVLEQVPPVAATYAHLQQRARAFYDFLTEKGFPLLIENQQLRSDTVLVLHTDAATERLRDFLRQRGIQPGSGYGNWKETTLRFANFPALTDADFARLEAALTAYPLPL